MSGGDRLDAATGWRWLLAAHHALDEARADIDALNVFPVPDGDTGTNLFLTLHTALEAVLASGIGHPGVSLSRSTTALALEALLAARGNSGVIFSQILRGVSEAVTEHPAADTVGLDARGLASCLDQARIRARQGVSRPVEGTILSVADAAADAALAAARSGAGPQGAPGSLTAVSGAALEAAQAALARTPELLPALREAGVVDAGGAGLVVVLAALHETLGGPPVTLRPWTAPSSSVGRGDQQAAQPSDGGDPAAAAGPPPIGSTRTGSGRPSSGAGAPAVARPASSSLLVGAPAGPPGRGAVAAYEVMYVLRALSRSAHDELRTALDYLGDSVLVAGDERATTVHVHTRDAGAAVEAAYAYGHPERLRITWLGHVENGPAEVLPGTVLRPTRGRGTGEAALPDPDHHSHSAVLACAPGPRLASAMAAAGAWVVLSAPGRRATTGDLLAARRQIPAHGVVLLANHDDTVMAAHMVERLANAEALPTVVVPSRAAVAGLAALAVHDPTASAAANARGMGEAADACRTGLLASTTRELATSAGLARTNDAVAYVDRLAVAVGPDLDAVADALLAGLLQADSELVTLVAGAPAADANGLPLASRLAQRLRAAHPQLEVTVVPGDAERYLLLVGVE